MKNGKTENITKTPGICGGRACIAGHRIRVMDVVVWHEQQKRSVPEIVAHFPGITETDVQAALAYYKANRKEIEDDFQNDKEWVKWIADNIPSKISAELRGNVGG